MVILVAIAQAAPVVCTAEAAVTLMADTGIAPDRVASVQPNLLPGLGRDQGDASTKAVLARLCADPEAVSIAPAEHWETGSFRASSFVVTRSETGPCAVVQDSAVLTLGILPGGKVTYRILEERPPTVTPILQDGSHDDPPCAVSNQYREERVLAGEGSDVRLVLVSDVHDAVTTTRLVVRRALPTGWHQQVLLDPAPARLIDDGSGPLVSLTPGINPWIVAHHDRIVANGTCVDVPGQTVWRWQEGAWSPISGRDALGRLADRGLWRLAGEDGWFVIVAQDAPGDQGLLNARMRKRQRVSPEVLSIRRSGAFPRMNAGFVIVAPDPWPSEAAAAAWRASWPMKTGSYVRQGWESSSACPP